MRSLGSNLARTERRPPRTACVKIDLALRLQKEGYTAVQIFERLGMNKGSLSRAPSRARRRGAEQVSRRRRNLPSALFALRDVQQLILRFVSINTHNISKRVASGPLIRNDSAFYDASRLSSSRRLESGLANEHRLAAYRKNRLGRRIPASTRRALDGYALAAVASTGRALAVQPSLRQRMVIAPSGSTIALVAAVAGKSSPNQ